MIVLGGESWITRKEKKKFHCKLDFRHKYTKKKQQKIIFFTQQPIKIKKLIKKKKFTYLSRDETFGNLEKNKIKINTINRIQNPSQFFFFFFDTQTFSLIKII